jgi:hypothetical protein
VAARVATAAALNEAERIAGSLYVRFEDAHILGAEFGPAYPGSAAENALEALFLSNPQRVF